MMDFSRQTGIFDPTTFSWPITFIGLGSIGSSATKAFAKLGVSRFRLFDDDKFENGNGPNQLLFAPTSEKYGPGHEGQSKLAVTVEMLERLLCQVDAAHEARYVAGTPLDGIVVSGVDSMEARSTIWEEVAWNGQIPLYLDGRLGGEFLELHAVNPTDLDDVTFYEKHLFPSSEAAKLPCNARSVISPALVLAGFMTSIVTRWHRGEPFPRKIIMDLVNFYTHTDWRP